MVLKSTEVVIDKNEVKFIIGDGTVVYKTDVNSFEKNSGLTIHNIEFSDLRGYYIRLKDLSSTFSCGNVVDNLVLSIKKEYDNILLVIDFNEVEEVSESFLKSYTKFLLETNNKVITINMNIAISNSFGSFITKSIMEEVE